MMKDRRGQHAEDGERAGGLTNAPADQYGEACTEFQCNDRGQEKLGHPELRHVFEEWFRTGNLRRSREYEERGDQGATEDRDNLFHTVHAYRWGRGPKV